MNTPFLQVEIPVVEVLTEIKNVGGVVSMVLALANIILFREFKRKDADLQRMMNQMAEDAKLGIKVSTDVENLLDRLVEEQSNGERRLGSLIQSETKAVRAVS